MQDCDSGRSRPTRRRRIPARDVKAKMLATAGDMAMEVGIGISLEDLSLEEVIRRARVPRSSVYRIWPYKGDFIDDLLCYLAGPDGWFHSSGAFDPLTYEVARKIMADHSDLLGTPQGRRGVLCEVVRQAVTRNFRAFQENRRWHAHVALSATVDSIVTDDVRANVAAALEDAEVQAGRVVADLIREIMARLGLRLRDPAHTIEHLVTAGRVLVRGLATHYNVAVTASDTHHRSGFRQIIGDPLPGPGINEQPAEWTLAAIAYLGLVDAFLEPDPDFRASGDGGPWGT